MPDIAVSPDQRERLRWIQRRLEEDVEYGHVRPCDALEYLLNHAETTGGLRSIDAEGGATPSVDDEDRHVSRNGAGADVTTETEVEAKTETEGETDATVGFGTLHTSPSANVVRIGNATTAHPDTNGETDSDSETEADSDDSDETNVDTETETQDDEDDANVDSEGAVDTDTTDDADDADGDESVDEGDDASEGEDDAPDESGVASAPPTLNTMMNLLETHDDKWREAGSGEEKYEVDLPDGTTEGARTKDDVKAVLFKQYR